MGVGVGVGGVGLSNSFSQIGFGSSLHQRK